MKNTGNKPRSKTSGMSKCGIDYDCKSQYLVLSKLEPLFWLHKHEIIKVDINSIDVATSPTGRGWHVRFNADLKGIPQRAIELMAGDDPWRHAFSLHRGEREQSPLFHHKWKNGKKYSEKHNAQMTKRVKEAFK